MGLHFAIAGEMVKEKRRIDGPGLGGASSIHLIKEDTLGPRDISITVMTSSSCTLKVTAYHIIIN